MVFIFLTSIIAIRLIFLSSNSAAQVLKFLLEADGSKSIVVSKIISISVQPNMILIFWALIWLHTLYIDGYSFSTEELVLQSMNIINQLRIQSPGKFICWIYDHSRDLSDKNLIQMILQHPKMNGVLRILTKSDTITEMYVQPSIVLIICGTNTRRLNEKFLVQLDIRTKVLVFVATTSKMQVNVIVDSLYDVNLYNVLFLSTTHDYVFHKLIMSDSFQAYRSELPFHMTFLDQMRNVEGYKVRSSMLHSSSTAYYHQRKMSGPAINWLQETTVYLNATYQLTVVNCVDIDELQECKKRRYWVDNRATDICLDFVTLLDYDPYYLDFVQPFVKKIIIPRGKSLDVLELFMEPFQGSVWITIVMLMILCNFVMFLMPNLIRENPFLFAVCGISTYNGKYNRYELILITSISVLFFFLLSAYETKFISFLINAPHKGTPHQLEQLMKIGMKVNTNTKDLDKLTDSRFNSIFQYHVTTTENKTLDRINGYLYEESDAYIAMSEQENWDKRTGSSYYVLMKDSLKLMVGFNFFSYRNPLLPKFRFTQRAFIESGLWKRWLEEIIVVHQQGFLTGQTLKADYGTGRSTLNMEDLFPAWVALFMGLGVTIIVFSLEILCSRVRLRLMQVLTRRR
uniref:ionotropic receptor 118 n=1 Tax=Aedes aegypti TaxID=7159 RepID=UPI000C292A85|nr:ionotropic receptor 118 [Aedes aegypti]